MDCFISFRDCKCGFFQRILRPWRNRYIAVSAICQLPIPTTSAFFSTRNCIWIIDKAHFRQTWLIIISLFPLSHKSTIKIKNSNYSLEMPLCCLDRRLVQGLSTLSRRLFARPNWEMALNWVSRREWFTVGRSLQTASTIESMLAERGIDLHPLSLLWNAPIIISGKIEINS
jgi:hypothetical protein